MNIVDLVIALLLISALVRGAQVGSLRQLLSTSGFFIGLFGGAWLEPKFIHLAHSPLSRTILALSITLGCALLLMSAGEYVGVVLKSALQNKERLNKIDAIFGSLVGAATLLLAVWLLASAIFAKLPFPGFQQDMRGSFVVSRLTRSLPPAPNVIAKLGHLVDPNGFPQVFTGLEPAPARATLPDIGALQAAVAKDAASVVKIEGEGCGGVVEGSGFVVAAGLVATNAHVVAGVAHAVVIDQSGQHTTTAVWFDPDLDLAVLSVRGLQEAPLTLSAQTASRGTASAVLGYPGGGNFSAQPAVVLDEFTATGRNIYNQNSTARDIYELQAHIIPGNSGGPLVAADGSVIGLVFAQSTTYNDTGYALTMPKVLSELHQAQSNPQPVSTGTCAE